MSRLRINFAPAGEKPRALGFGVGSLALAALLCAAWLQSSTTEAGLPLALTPPPAEEEIAAINVATEDLNFPWLNLLGAVENSLPDGVRLNQLEADARDGLLTLDGEAADRKLVLELPGRLRAQPAVLDARVLNSSPAGRVKSGGGEEGADGGVLPIRFVLEVRFHE